MPVPNLKPLIFDEVEALEDATGLRYELWDGEPMAMTGGTLAHNLIALGLYQVIDNQLKPPCVATVADMGLRLSEAADSNKAYPDVMVTCEPLSGHYQMRPVLLAEVLSDSSVKRDRIKKRAVYKSLDSAAVYLILSQQDIQVDVYRSASNWTRERFQGLEAVIELEKPMLTLPLRDIYAKVLDLGLLGVDEEPSS